MALPSFDVPKYKLELPSTGQVVEYRPFLVKEQKVLLMAAGAGIEEQADAVLNVIDACTFGRLNVKTLRSFDAEYMFLQIRSRSVGEKVDLLVTCGSCGHVQNDQMDITKAAVIKTPGHTPTIEVSDRLTIVMKYPSLADMETQDTRTVEETIALVARNIAEIYEGDEKYDTADYSMADLIEFVESLDPAGLEKLEVFFDTMPILKQEIGWTCHECSKPNAITMTGLKSFFV